MSTSRLGYYVRGADAEIVGQRAMDTAAVRDIANNLNHLQDEATQTWGNLCMPVSGKAYFEQATVTAGTLNPLDYMPPIVGVLRPLSDGSSTRIIVRVRCYVSSAGTGTFRVALRSFDEPGLRTSVPSTGDAASSDFTTTATSAEEHRVTLYVPYLSNLWMTDQPSLDQSGNAASVSPYMGQVEVWAYGSAGGVHPRVEGVTVREYIGA